MANTTVDPRSGNMTSTSTSAEAERAAAADKAAAETKKHQEEAEKLRAEHGKLAAQAAEDRAKAERVETPEQAKARESAQKADDAAAKAAEAERKARGTVVAATVADAKIFAPVDPAMSAGSHLAQKFGNDPANPKPAIGLDERQEMRTVHLSRPSPDHRGDLIHTSCHPDMKGDYLRAGWSLDEIQLFVMPASDKKAESARTA